MTMTTTKRPKTVTYYGSMRWTETDTAGRTVRNLSMQTQWYGGVGSVYVVIYDGSRMMTQGGMMPEALGKRQKAHIKQLKADNMVEVTLGTLKTLVRDENGDWAEQTTN